MTEENTSSNQNKFIIPIVMSIVIVIVITQFASPFIIDIVNRNKQDTIRVGILHSLTGTLAISETSVVDATLLAIEEINAQGGVLGKQIEPIVVDGRSDWSRLEAILSERESLRNALAKEQKSKSYRTKSALQRVVERIKSSGKKGQIPGEDQSHNPPKTSEEDEEQENQKESFGN